MKLGDVIAVRGKGFLSEGILAATGNTVSHVGVITKVVPRLLEVDTWHRDYMAIVTQALTKVEDLTVFETVRKAEKAWLLSCDSLTDAQRKTIAAAALEQEGDSYGYYDLGLQLADAVFRTRWFTDTLFVDGREHPICSFVVARAYKRIGMPFVGDDRSVTPADIFAALRWTTRREL